MGLGLGVGVGVGVRVRARVWGWAGVGGWGLGESRGRVPLWVPHLRACPDLLDRLAACRVKRAGQVSRL